MGNFTPTPSAPNLLRTSREIAQLQSLTEPNRQNSCSGLGNGSSKLQSLACSIAPLNRNAALLSLVSHKTSDLWGPRWASQSQIMRNTVKSVRFRCAKHLHSLSNRCFCDPDAGSQEPRSEHQAWQEHAMVPKDSVLPHPA